MADGVGFGRTCAVVFQLCGLQHAKLLRGPCAARTMLPIMRGILLSLRGILLFSFRYGRGIPMGTGR